MESYSIFAKVYDDYMADIPYGAWTEGVVSYLGKHGYSGTDMLELGCGTATLSIGFAKAGYNVVATDLSADMLSVARKKTKSCKNIILKQQDMRALNLSQQFPVIVSLCDSVNYMADEEELAMVFESVKKNLCDGGIFLFDLKKKSFYEELSDNVYADEIAKGNYVWENYYDEENLDNFYYITFYVKSAFGLYKKYVEEHVQHVFERDTVIDVADKCGFKLKDCFGLQGSEERDYYVFERK